MPVPLVAKRIDLEPVDAGADAQPRRLERAIADTLREHDPPGVEQCPHEGGHSAVAHHETRAEGGTWSRRYLLGGENARFLEHLQCL